MKKSISDFFAARKAEVADRTQAVFGAPQPKSFFDEAVVDMDGSIAPTYGECKQGMGMSDKGEWGYHPLIVSLANTNEILFATFLQAMITLPAQIVRSGRQTIVRLLNMNDWTATFFQLVEQLRPAKYARRE